MPEIPTIPEDVQAVRDQRGFIWRREVSGGNQIWRRSTGAWTIDADRMISHSGPLVEVEETNDAD